MRWLDHVIAAAPNFFASARKFSNFSTSLATRLHSAIRNRKSKIEMSRQSDSNRRPADYKSAALPAELCRRLRGKTSPSRSFATLIVPPNCTPFEFNRLAAACELVGSGLTAPFSLRLFRKQVDSFNVDVRWECCIRSRATSFSPLYWRSSAFAG